MHTTRVVLKDGTNLVGILVRARPMEGYMVLGVKTDDLQRIELNSIRSVVTEAERIKRGQIGDHDELAHWRKYMQDGRRLGWDGLTPETPLQEWEHP